MTKGLISIVVPVYNAEKYLEDCVSSILAQTYTNIEVLLVDDGSTDGSGAICDAFAEKDNRVRVLHKPNGGAPSARNVGMDVAEGEFIGFVDSDDTIDANMYECMHKRINETGADIAVCGFKYNLIFENIILYFKMPGEQTLSPAQLWSGYMEDMSKYRVVAQTPPWNKLIRANLLEQDSNIGKVKLRQQEEPRRTSDGRGLTDSSTAFCADCFSFAINGITLVDIAPYNYFIRFASNVITNTLTIDVMLQHMRNSMMSAIPHEESQINRTIKNIKHQAIVSQSHEAMIRNQPKSEMMKFKVVASVILHHPNLMPKLQAVLAYCLPKSLYFAIFRMYCKYAIHKE